jgi:hypothetical protein
MDDMEDVVYQFIMGLLIGIIPFGLIEFIGWNVPSLRKKFYGKPKDNPTLIFGYHVHHTVLGLLSLIWGLYLFSTQSDNSFFLIGLGIGMIIIHTVAHKKLVFIEKVK